VIIPTYIQEWFTMPSGGDLGAITEESVLGAEALEVDRSNISRICRNVSSALQAWKLTSQYSKAQMEIIRITKEKTGYDAKLAQVHFALVLHFGREGSCVAATGFGKSLPFQIAVFMLQKRNEKRPKNTNDLESLSI